MGFNIINGQETMTAPIYVAKFAALAPFTPNANTTVFPSLGTTDSLAAGTYLCGWGCRFEFASAVRNYETFTVSLYNVTASANVSTDYMGIPWFNLVDNELLRNEVDITGVFTLAEASTLTLAGKTNGTNPASGSVEITNAYLWALPIGNPVIIEP